MQMAKRIFLFLLTNLLVIGTISLVLRLLGVQPYLTQYGIDYAQLAIFCLVWGMGGSLISLALSRFMAKASMGVKVIDPNTSDPVAQALVRTVHDLSRAAGLPKMPQVGVYDSPEVNAFATGPTKSRALVAVSTGLLRRMERHEVEGVLGHEIAHIANGDMVTMTLLQGIVNAFAMFLARILAFAIDMAFSSRRTDDEEESRAPGGMANYFLVMIFEFAFTILGSMVVAAFSRWREFRADAGGAALAGRENMIAALQRLQSVTDIRDPRQPASAAAMKISGKGMLALFSTHPPLEKRIATLRAA